MPYQFEKILGFSLIVKVSGINGKQKTGTKCDHVFILFNHLLLDNDTHILCVVNDAFLLQVADAMMAWRQQTLSLCWGRGWPTSQVSSTQPRFLKTKYKGTVETALLCKPFSAQGHCDIRENDSWRTSVQGPKPHPLDAEGGKGLGDVARNK